MQTCMMYIQCIYTLVLSSVQATQTKILIHIHTCTHIHIHTCTHIHTCAQAKHAHTVHICKQKHTYARARAHTHTHTHTHTPRHMHPPPHTHNI